MKDIGFGGINWNPEWVLVRFFHLFKQKGEEMNEYLRLAKKLIEEGKSQSGGLYLTERRTGEIAVLSLFSIAKSLERLADKFAPRENEEKC